VTPAALVFFLSYVFIIVFTILNVLIGIVINAMDESRAQEQKAMRDHWREILDAVDGLEKDGDANREELVILRQEIIRVQSKHLSGEPSPVSPSPQGSARRGVGKRNTGGSRATER
jgi:voltage-gated sodium channel